MKRPAHKPLLLILAALCLAAGAVGFAVLRPPRPVDMALYVPKTAWAFVEFRPLPRLRQAVTETRFWEEVAPAVGFPDQLASLGESLDWWRVADVGPDEAAVAARAQFALVVTGTDAEGVPSAEHPGLELTVIPHWTLIVKSHTSASRVERLLRNRFPLVSRKMFGPQAVVENKTLDGVPTVTCRAPGGSKTLLAASDDDVMYFSNEETSLRACLECRDGRRAPLADLPALQTARAALFGDQTLVFGFAGPRGVGQFLRLGSMFIPENIRQTALALSDEALTAAVPGLAYAAQVENRHVTDKYLLLLEPELAAALRAHVRPPDKPVRIFEVLPATFTDCMTATIQDPPAVVEKTLQHVSANSNVAVAFALRQALNALGERYGLDPRESLSDAVGDEIALTKLSPDSPPVLAVEARNRVRLLGPLDRHLRADGATLTNENHRGLEIVASSHKDRRAAAFLGDFLVLGTLPQLKIVADAYLDGKTLARVPPAQAWPDDSNAKTSLLRTYRNDAEDLETAVLAVARLSRAGDAGRERLRDPAIKKALAALPPSFGRTELQSEGIYGETHSAIGNLALLAYLIGPEPPLEPTVAPLDSTPKSP